MKIDSFSYIDYVTGLEIAATFNSTTFLTGPTGAGKTRLYAALREVCGAVDSKVGVPEPARWAVEFETAAGAFSWTASRGEGGFYLEERLLRGDQELFSRREEHATYGGGRLPRLNRHMSLIEAVSGEIPMAELRRELQAIVFLDASSSVLERVWSFSDRARLQSQVTAVFPTVRGFDFFDEVVRGKGQRTLRVIEEPHVWVPENRLSSGIKRTFALLSRMAAEPAGTLFVVDDYGAALSQVQQATLDGLIAAHTDGRFILMGTNRYVSSVLPAKAQRHIRRSGCYVTTVFLNTNNP